MIEADFHREYKTDNLQRELGGRSWRWFVVRLTGLSSESGWSYALFPYDESTGKRERRELVMEITDPAAIDAYFARQAG